MNKDETPSQYEDEYVTKTESYSSVPSALQHVPPRYDQLETRVQNLQCCMPCNNRLKNNSRFNWRRLLSYLPSWMKGASPAGPAGLPDTVAASKPNPTVQVCHANTHSGHQHVNQVGSEKRCSKRASYERIISNYNFDELSTDQKSCCDPCTQKGWSVCGKHSSNAESVDDTKHIQVGIAEVSSHKTKSRCCICSKKPAQKTSNTSCQQSLIEQAWEYLQSIIFTHRSGCPRCNKPPPSCPNPKPTCPNAKPPCPDPKPPCPNSKPPCPNAKPPCPNAKPPCPNAKLPCVSSKASYDSSCCKESLFELAKAYLKKITSEHKSGCPRCKQQPTCCCPKEPSFLRTMLEQAWACIKKSCEQKTCQQQGALSCCTHPSTRTPVCSNPGILKYPTNKSACCCSESVPDCPKKKSCQAVSCPKPVTCPKICEKNTPPAPCKSEEEGTHEHKSCYTPCCIHNSQGVQPSFTSGSHHKSCCLSQLSIKAQKLPLCSKPCKDSSHQSAQKPLVNVTCIKDSSASMLGREIMGFRSNTDCAGPCAKDPNDGQRSPGSGGRGSPGRTSPGRGSPMQGLSLTMEPKDHKFCTRPKECKHSKQSLENMESSSPPCKKVCSGPCNVSKGPTYEQEAQTPALTCPGGCSKCTSLVAAAPMYHEHRMVDAEYEAFLDEQFGRLVTKQLLDKETICETGCSCMTCIASLQTSRKDPKSNRKDPNNYRYYY